MAPHGVTVPCRSLQQVSYRTHHFEHGASFAVSNEIGMWPRRAQARIIRGDDYASTPNHVAQRAYDGAQCGTPPIAGCAQATIGRPSCGGIPAGITTMPNTTIGRFDD
jgi:hypothetical protein